MKTNIVQVGHALIVMVMALAFSSVAKVPEPDTILFGTVRTTKGVQVCSTESQTFKIQAVVNGEVLATAKIASVTNTFVLRIPMDDGVSPRIPGTAKSADLVRVEVVNGADGTVVETSETQLEAKRIPDERGSVIAMDFQIDSVVLGDDQDGDGMPDEWEARYSSMPSAGVRPMALGLNDSQMDNDGDGISNLGEYVAGTNPLDGLDTFTIRGLEIKDDRALVRFGPVVANRLYTLLYRESLSGKWLVIDQYRAMKSEDEETWETVPMSSKGFYRLRVELLP